MPPAAARPQVLESFKIMDYSLLLGVHNMDQQERERRADGAQGPADEKRPPPGQKALYSTAMESIQGGAARGESIDTDDTWVSAPFRPTQSWQASWRWWPLGARPASPVGRSPGGGVPGPPQSISCS